ncbi:aldehyde dehydrogenase family protein [Streptomyces sp. NPDC096311]|uniref:aldehyde dehydrogenase family protein n=1 Tax=Streptomyces sp. NPDC096311 TaxID=3366083 RepID=UPI003802921C
MTASFTLDRTDWQILIDGTRTNSQSQRWFEVQDPATGEAIARVPDCTAGEVDAAVRAARRAYEGGWRYRSARERGQLLFSVADVIRRHADELAWLETREVGKPLRDSRNFDVAVSIALFEYFGGLADKVDGEFLLQGPTNAQVVPEPYGVVGAILPFNWPPIHLAGKIAPALATGNTIVLKPGEQAPLVALRMIELMQEVLPSGVVNSVTGRAAGPALAGHPMVGRLTFTGASETGKAVMRSAADNLTMVTMELGGKNPLIVFEDADLDDALRGAIEGMYFNQGEACTSTSRLLLHASVHDRFLERFCAATEGLHVGDGLDEATDIGPMVDRAQQERVLSYIEIGQQEGARVAARGRVPDDPKFRNGFWVAPTVFTGVTEKMRIAQEEIFGPVCSVMRFESYEEAIRIANSTDYGLTAAVYTRDQEQASRAARDIEAGIVFVNNYFRGSLLGSPFGGMKASGFGRENAKEALREFVRSKNVRMPSGFGQTPAWAPVDRLVPRQTSGSRDGEGSGS